MKQVIAFVALLLGGVQSMPAQAVPDVRAAIRDSVTAWRTRNHDPVGLAVGVYWHGRVLLTDVSGTTALGSGDAVTTRTVFHLASVTKPVVATAIMQLVEQGKVALDAPVTRYLPYFRMRDPVSASITVQQLLTHTAGVPDVTDYRWEAPEYDAGALERYIRGLADSSLVFPPGARWQYSNIGFEILADVIAKVSGEPFEDYVQRHILRPAGMRHSTLLMTDVDSANLARGHNRNSAGAATATAAYPYNRRHAASSTLHANVIDMLRWIAINVRSGALDGHRMLSAASIDRMRVPAFDLAAIFAERARSAGRTMRYTAIGQGLGWRVYTLPGAGEFVSHSGGDLGFRSDVLLRPADTTGVVVMTNEQAPDPAELSQIVMGILRRAAR